MFHSNFSLQSEAKEAYSLVYSSFEKGYRKKTKQNKTKQNKTKQNKTKVHK